MTSSSFSLIPRLWFHQFHKWTIIKSAQLARMSSRFGSNWQVYPFWHRRVGRGFSLGGQIKDCWNKPCEERSDWWHACADDSHRKLNVTPNTQIHVVLCKFVNDPLLLDMTKLCLRVAFVVFANWMSVFNRRMLIMVTLDTTVNENSWNEQEFQRTKCQHWTLALYGSSSSTPSISCKAPAWGGSKCIGRGRYWRLHWASPASWCCCISKGTRHPTASRPHWRGYIGRLRQARRIWGNRHSLPSKHRRSTWTFGVGKCGGRRIEWKSW